MLIGHTPYIPVGEHSQLTGLSSQKTITINPGEAGVLVQAITQNVRMVIGGANAASASNGFQIVAGAPTVFVPAMPGQVLKFFEETASAVVQYQRVQRFD